MFRSLWRKWSNGLSRQSSRRQAQKSKQRPKPLLERLEDRMVPSANLVKDLNLAEQGSSPAGMVELNGNVLFAADDGSTGQELWKSNIATGATSRVKDIRPGS